MTTSKLRTACAAVAICGLLSTSARTARADTLSNEVHGAEIGIGVGVAVAVGFVVYFLVRHDHSTITGCVVSSADGLQLHSEGDPHTFALIGDTATIKPGDRVRVSGKRKKRTDPAVNPSFTVEKLSRDFGPCTHQAP